jgi:hypothetical protein
LSPGLFREVSVRRVTRIPLDTPVEFPGEGVLAFDGDRDHKIPDGHALSVTIRRDGPWIIDIPAAMRWAVAERLIADTRGDISR